MGWLGCTVAGRVPPRGSNIQSQLFQTQSYHHNILNQRRVPLRGSKMSNLILPPQYIESNHSYTMLNLILMLFSICTSEISQIQLCCFYEVGFVGSSKTDLDIKHLCPRSWMISVISCAICWQSGAVFDDDKDVCLNAAEDYSVHSFQIKLFKLRWKGFWGKHTLPLGANNLWDLFFQFQ